MPNFLCVSLQTLISDEVFLPPTYFIGFERSRLDFDTFGATRNHTKETQKMMLGLFFVTKVLVRMLLLDGYKHGLPFERNTPVAM